MSAFEGLGRGWSVLYFFGDSTSDGHCRHIEKVKRNPLPRPSIETESVRLRCY
jgi:hypothetical protein